MKTFVVTFCWTALVALLPSLLSAQDVRPDGASDVRINAETDWPWWRGPARNGVASSQQKPPTEWNDAKNVLWKSPVSGRGHGSPTIVGNRIFLATADEEKAVQSVLCFDRETGTQLWKTDIHSGNFVTAGINKKSSQASSTPACDGERVVINFPNSAAIWTTALSLDGKQQWQTRISDYVLHQGYGSSPAIYESLVLVASDNKGGGAVAGLQRGTGKEVWKQSRPKLPNYPSPIVLKTAGKDQLFMIGCDLVSSFDPLSGKKFWEIEGSTTECVTSTVTDGKLIFTSGGYPRNHVAAVTADGSGKIVWNNPTRAYVPSLLIKDGYLYAATDGGVAMCWESATGKEVWKGRLGGDFTASPILVGDVIYATNEAGETFLFKASPESFELLGKNKLGNEVYSTPTIVGGRVYVRVAINAEGKRQEVLYCLGQAG